MINTLFLSSASPGRAITAPQSSLAQKNANAWFVCLLPIPHFGALALPFTVGRVTYSTPRAQPLMATASASRPLLAALQRRASIVASAMDCEKEICEIPKCHGQNALDAFFTNHVIPRTSAARAYFQKDRANIHTIFESAKFADHKGAGKTQGLGAGTAA